MNERKDALDDFSTTPRAQLLLLLAQSYTLLSPSVFIPARLF